ncbi:MAG TPA: hypothetical protein VEL28_01310 [Candidatus Binatia bacterium]|nr:hypothetical protein [Candidatus Binatia bacterium]
MMSKLYALPLAALAILSTGPVAEAGSSGIVYRTPQQDTVTEHVYVTEERAPKYRRLVIVGPSDEDPSGMAMAADFLIARPLGLVSTLLGAGIFVGSLPFSAASGDVDTPADRLVADPATYTFYRPLGDID